MRSNVYDAFKEKIYTGSYNKNLLPFIDLTNEVEVLNWLTNDIKEKMDSRATRLEVIKRLMSMYKGIGYYPEGAKRHRDDDGASSEGLNITKSFVNFVNEMVDAKIAQRSRFKPGISVIPMSDNDIEDENNAELSKLVLTAKAQEIDLETVLADGDQSIFLTGEQYTYIYWDKNKGGMNKRYSEAKEQGIILEDDIGMPIEEVPNGDFCVEVLGPDRAYHQLKKNRIEDCDDFSVIKWVHIDELKHDYPHVADKITAGDISGAYTSSSMYNTDKENMAMVVCYYHRPTKYLPMGAKFEYTRDAILEGGPFPYKHGKLPFVFDTDITVNDEITGRPFTANLERLQRLHDMVMYSTAKGYAISSSPKWMYPKGAVDPNKLGNKYSSLEFKGPTAPQLVSFNGVNSAGGDIMQISERYIEKSSTVFGISRGDAPKKITAAIALQFLDEQEQQRESRGMAKRQARTIKIYKMMMAMMAQYYKKGDGRFSSMIGNDNDYLINDIDKVDFTRCADIRFENASAISDTKTGRIATIIDVNAATQNDPEGPYFKKNEITQILELGNDKRFRDSRLSSTKAAQTKIGKILRGEPCPNPRDWDDFIVEYPLFVETLQQREYKGEHPTIMSALEAYITQMEYLMWEKAQVNQIFKLKMSQLLMYPVFFKVPLNALQAQAAMTGAVNPTDVMAEQRQGNKDEQQAMNENLKRQQETAAQAQQ